jgi:hypothetical protein
LRTTPPAFLPRVNNPFARFVRAPAILDILVILKRAPRAPTNIFARFARMNQ